MAVLDDLMPALYDGVTIVGREMVGFIPTVDKDATAEQAAKGETIRVSTGTAGELEDIEEAMDTPSGNDGSLGKVDMQITNAKVVPFYWGGEANKGVKNSGQFQKIITNQFADAVRKLVNAVETDLARAAIAGASRAYGTAGTTPFGTAGDFTDFAKMAQILDDNGCPKSNRSLVLSSEAFANLRGKQNLLLKVNEAGTDEFLRYGYTSPVQGFTLWNSAGLETHKKGTGASYVTNLVAVLKKGDKVIGLDEGTGTVLAGDIVTFAGDNNKYVVNKGIEAAGSIEIGAPGLRGALADGVAMTVGGDYTPSVAFHRDALKLLARAPATPDAGDNALDSTVIYDPVSGLSFEVRVYGGYRKVRYEVGLAWGVKCVQPEFCALLLG